MIAGEDRYLLWVLVLHGADDLDDAGGVGAPIDKIAEENVMGVSAVRVRAALVEEGDELKELTMDVADDDLDDRGGRLRGGHEGI